MKPSGTKSAHPSIAPPNDTWRITIRENTTRLWTFISGVRPSAAPSAIPAATCPGVPSECSVLMMDWISFSRASMVGNKARLGSGARWTAAATVAPADTPPPLAADPPIIPHASSPPAPHVHKFGGASLADSTAVRHAVEIVRRHRAEPTVVVVSAMAGTTDALLEVAQQAGTGESRTVASLIARLRSRHAEVARSLLPGGRLRADVLLYITDLFAELEALAQGLRLLRELTPRTTDYVVSRGERLSARLVAAALEAGGARARYVDALDLIAHRRRLRPGGPRPRRHRPRRPAGARPTARQGRGAGGAGLPGRRRPNGEIATLGRGGSDLTATLLARALGAARVSLWKDVPGLLTADPRVVPDARVIPQLHAREAAELAYYGAKVLHPRALIPVAGRRIPVFVRPFADPELAGHRGLRAGRPGPLPGEGADRRRRPGAGHRHRERHARRARHRRAHLRRAARQRGSPSR